MLPILRVKEGIAKSEWAAVAQAGHAPVVEDSLRW